MGKPIVKLQQLVIMLKIKRIVIGGRQQKGRYISFSASNGTISVSHQTVEDLNITEKDKAVFFQDIENPSKWYFSFGAGGDYTLKSYKNSGKYPSKVLGFSNTALRDMVYESINLPKKTARLWLSSEPVEVEGKKLWLLNYRK